MNATPFDPRAADEAASEWAQDQAAHYQGGQRNFDEFYADATLYTDAAEVIAKAAAKVAELIGAARHGRASRLPIDPADMAERMLEAALDPLLQSGAYPVALAGVRAAQAPARARAA